MAVKLIQMKEIIDYIKRHGGYARMSELRSAGFQTRDISILCEQGSLEKIKAGLYKLSSSDVTSGNVDISKAIPEAVIALVSALSFHELTTFNPPKVHIAIPHEAKSKEINFPPVEVYYFRKAQYEPGIEKVNIQGHNVRIYKREKTVCDMFRYRNKLGEDLALEGLQNYLNRSDSNLSELSKYMKICRVKTVMEPYVKAMIVRFRNV
jgi:predicted transcriptional regulator of viral defense system